MVSRHIFCDADIFAREVDRIFNRSWLFLAHASEIPNPGDYLTRPMGGDQVIVARGQDGEVRAFINACQHRGMPLARVDAGNALRWVCPYHGWTYNLDGALRSTSFDHHYDKASFAGWGLKPVAQLAEYHGLIFASWSQDAGPLEAHLGELAWYLDLLFARTPGGMRVLGPPQRWIVNTNWKLPALNFIDSQHAIRTHRGPMTMAQAAGAPPLPIITQMAEASVQLTFAQGHGAVLSATGAGSEKVPPFFGHAPEVVPLYEHSLSSAQWRQLRDGPPGVGTIFPNTSWVEQPLAVAADAPPASFLVLRNWQPLAVDRLEVWSWCFAPAEASEASCAAARRIALQTFGVGGIFEEDDAEVWASLMRAISGAMASREGMNFSAGLGAAPLANYPNPGAAYQSVLTEHAQWNYLRRWQALMDVPLSGSVS